MRQKRMAETARLSWTATLQLLMQRKALAMLALGFGCGLPFFLVFDTLSAWLRGEGLSLERIAFFSLATLSYAFKFLWAPLLDRTALNALAKCRFSPATLGGVPQASWTQVRFVWKLGADG